MKIFVSILLGIFIHQYNVAGQENSSFTNVNNEGIAISGYDPVSYFLSDSPEKGFSDYSFEYNGATYLFSSNENLNLFLKNPEKYEPAYGGYCAYAMGNGYLAEVNPETYKILDDKLLLFYNKLLVNTLTRWDRNEDTLYPAAEQNWKDKSAFQK